MKIIIFYEYVNTIFNLFFKCDETGSLANDDKKNKGSSQSTVHPLAQRKSMAGSIKRYSLKLRRNTKEGIKEIMSSDGDCT